MANAYSEDLRIRSLALIEGGNPITVVSILLKVGRSTLYRWLDRQKKEGHVKARTKWRKGHSHKLKDLEAFRVFIDENQGLNAIEMAEKWGNITPKTIRVWLHRIGYTRKKRPTDTKSGMKPNVTYFWSR